MPLFRTTVALVLSALVLFPAARGDEPERPQSQARDLVRTQRTLDELLASIAVQLADDLAKQKVEKIGVLEFTNDTPQGETLGGFGVLGRYCSETLQRQLLAKSEGRFRVVDGRRLQEALTRCKLSIADLGNSDALARLAKEAGGMSAIVTGTLRNRAGRTVELKCRAVETVGNSLLGEAGDTALLNESEWGMLGRSAVVRPEDRRPDGQRPVAAVVVEKMDQRAKGPHPMQDPNFPFRVKVMVGGKERQAVFRGNEMLVPLAQGEVYEIWIETRSPQAAVMRLLVDGLNTLPEEENAKGISTQIVAQRVNLDSAREWVIDPARAKVFAVRGFVSETGEQGKLYPFKVVDGGKSLAARQHFTEQVGLITAAFYSAVDGGKGPGTDFDAEKHEKLTEDDKNRRAGNLLAVVNIRYVYPEEISK